MRPLGHALLWIGFVVAAFVTTRQADAIAWGWYGAAASIGVVGVALLRGTARRAAADAETVRENIGVLETSTRKLVDRIAAMNRERAEVFVYDVHGRIDAEMRAELAAFAEARESMIPAIGLQQYAEVMDRFARAERFVNRAWSASADGYVDEVWSCMESAEESMREADRLLREQLARVG
ncbi:MAG: hypothetical protein GF346_01675 [Candidatus Eisenbacteria bacterium]|nr:hypothetical protein [Candidatus Latescibacterota bacterium]MBD3301140.1 hypothetical protein [Candidatus Eisenbacteria bacterium]